jgi:hypothetical protein
MSFRTAFESDRELIEDIIRRLDDLERGGHPFRWDAPTRSLFYVVPRTGEEVLVCTEVCCPCEGDPAPIWLCTTIRQGDSTWTSLDGQTRTLDPLVAAITADGGIVPPVHPSISNIDIRRIDLTSPLLADEVEHIVEFGVSTWWTYPDGMEHYTTFRYQDDRQRVAIEGFGITENLPGPGFHAGRAQYTIGDLSQPYTNATVGDPASVGLSGYERGRLRQVSQLNAVGVDIDGEFFMAKGATGGFVSQGADTYTSGGDNSPRDEFWWDSQKRQIRNSPGAVDYRVPNHHAPYIIHDFSISHDGTVLAAMTETQIAALADLQILEPGVSPTERTYQINADRELAGGILISPGGAPIFIRVDHGSGTTDPDITYVPKVFTDGDPLTTPAIAVAQYDRPDQVSIVNEDPLTWEPSEGSFVLAVADLAGFEDLTDGWPTSYWPFGPIRGVGGA